MSLRDRPVTATVVLPDGREAAIRVGVPDDDYVSRRDLDTVALELRVSGVVAAALNTVLDADQTNAARQLVRELADGLASGRLEPTAAALEPLADELRPH